VTVAPLTDTDARDRLRFELNTTFFVEAGAGTGKTTALVTRIVELIADGGLQMERLAAITFTEAAAAELRDRIRQELENAALCRTDIAERHLCEAAASQVDLASIQTIHAFAGGLLRTYPLEADLPPNFTMQDEIQQERAFDDRFRAWLYDEVPNQAFPERRSAVRRVLALGMSPEQLRELATRLQDYRDLVNPSTRWAVPSLPDPVLVAHVWGERLIAQVPALEEAFDAQDRLAQELRRLQPVAERMAAVQDHDDALRLLGQCNPKHTAGAAGNWPTGRCGELKLILKECADNVCRTLTDHRTAAIGDLLSHLRDFTLAYAGERRHDGKATFHDLLTWARDLLRDGPDVRRRAQSRFDRVFVDEFQDTDPLQVEIAWFLTSDPAQATEPDWTKLHLIPGKLFLVGDPKQSIYRFRRADIGIYQQVYAQLERATDRVVLSQSFRSPAPMVEWFNHHFSEDMQFIDRAQPAYRLLDARPAGAVDPLEAGFGVRHVGERIDAAGDRWLAEAQAIARTAALMVNGEPAWRVADQGSDAPARGARYSDVCVLIPSRTNLRRLERAFGQQRVPYRIESGWLVLHTQEVRDLLSCLRAIDDPSDQVALVAALRSPAYGCSDVDLLRWIDDGHPFDYERPLHESDGPVRDALESLRTFHADRLNHTPAALTENFIHDRMLAVQAFGTPQPRDALRRLRYVVAQARTLASSGQTTLRELCDWLESRQREPYYDAESVVPDADEDAVRFMTVHGAKGLEFPIVILTGLGTATNRVGPRSVDLVPNYNTGVLDIRCGEFTTVGYDQVTEKAMYEAEQKRLLYVATTRARDHLVLSLYHGKDDCHARRILKRLGVRPELSRELVLGPMPGADSADSNGGDFRLPASEEAADEHRVAELALQAHRRSLIERLANQRLVAPSSLAHLPEPQPPDPPPEPDPNNTVRRLRPGRGGSTVGRAVHAVLQVIDLATLAELDPLAEAAAHDEDIVDSVDQVKAHVRNAARSAPVQDALASGRYWREVPVGCLQGDGTILEGAIDLMYAQQDGTLVIVDYKTDRVAEHELTSRAESYRAQGEAYARSVALVTGQPVGSIVFVFAALAGRVRQFAV
jgi:ATP-dependent helicase/nuclease subunit A